MIGDRLLGVTSQREVVIGKLKPDVVEGDNVMRHAIALDGSLFNTQRMVLQYVTKAYSW